MTPQSELTGCSVTGCDRVPQTPRSVLCSGHKMRFYRTGDVQAEIPLRPLHSGAVDEWMQYGSAHRRVTNARGKASLHNCVVCNQTADEWSYDHQGRYEFSGEVKGRTVSWSSDPQDYSAKCKSCHNRYDNSRLKVLV